MVMLRMESIMQGPEIRCVVRTFEELLETRDARKFIVDFRAVKYFSSRVLSLLIDLNRRIAEIGGKFVLLGLPPHLLKLFRITGIEQFFTFRPTEELALMYLKNE